MKISKSTLLGLGVLSAFLAIGLSVFSSNRALAAPALQWDTNQIKGVSSAEVLSLVPNSGNRAYGERANQRCTYARIILLNSANGNAGRYYEMRERSIGGGRPEQGGVVPAELTRYLGTQGFCYITSGPENVTIGGTYGQAATVEGDTSAADLSACEKNAFGLSLTWILCPLLDVADGATNALYDLFTSQLSFSLDQLGDGQAQVQKSWALMRDIATALIVIIALVMILSQAVSIGPFDAYTIRKMLPRIVAAVILIQISWVGAKFAIGLVNAIASGIADLMYFPFGGSGKMGLFALLQNAGLSTTELVAINWAGLIVGVALGAAFLFAMLGFAFTAILALLVALFTLIFRKILIILLVIFAPLALLAWILPGTERYWKMWRENFIKVLFMFPIVVALIAAGRIFAYVVGAQGINSAADTGNLLSLIFVLVGFFGPLFILPKTFKWGGQAMGLAAGAINTASSKAGAPGKKFFGNRQEGWTAERKRKSQERYAHNEGFSLKRPKSLYQRPIDLLRSGQIDPTLQGRRKRQAMTAYAAHGEESDEKDLKEATIRANMLFSQTNDHDGLARQLAAGNFNNFETFEDEEYNRKNEITDEAKKRKTGKIGNVDKEIMKRVGLDSVLKYGGDSNIQFLDAQITELRGVNATAKDQELAKKFLDANVSSLLPKMKHFYYGPERESAIASSIGSMNAQSFVGMEGTAAQDIIQSLSTRIKSGKDAAIRIQDGTSVDTVADAKLQKSGSDATSQLRTVLTHYNSAINNANLSVGTGVNKAFEALVDGNNLDEIDKKRISNGLLPISTTAADSARSTPEIAGTIDQLGLKGRIDATSGNVTPRDPTNPTAPTDTGTPPPTGGRTTAPPPPPTTPPGSGPTFTEDGIDLHPDDQNPAS